MAGEQETKEKEESIQRDEGFIWDADSNLFYHACTGFYHDPVAGWYYSTRDGLYYTFQDGNYVLLQSKTHEESEANPAQANECFEDNCPCEEEDPESYSRPSEWLDEILINQYLSGYPQNPDDQSTDLQTDIVQLSSEEESWLAQYGQVERPCNDVNMTSCNNINININIQAIDLWDWELVREGQNGKIAKLTGHLASQSSKLHPSCDGFIKTAAINETHLDLVRVSSGKVYRLRTASRKYLGTLSAYDSCNPTKDWGFPIISTHSQSQLDDNNIIIHTKDDTGSNLDQITNNEEKKLVYRDRAAERRKLHGINGIAPCEKELNNYNNDDEIDLYYDATSAQEEARQLSFGTGSYARKIMQNMGWKHGEALGSSQKGIVEPVQAVGNKGQAGLGWN